MDDRKRVLFITEARNFLVNTIIKEIGESGFRVTIAEVNPSALRDLTDEPDVIILNILGKVVGLKAVLTYIRDFPTEKYIRLYLIGEQKEFPHIYEHIPPDAFSGRFARPVDTKGLIRQMREDLALDDEKAAEEERKAKRKKILIVDDDATLLRMMKNLFSEYYDTIMINSGREAINFFDKNTVDLVLLDYEMPEVNGPVVLRNLRTMPNSKDTPVMFLTAKKDRESVMEAASLKPEKYLLKSLKGTELLEIVNEFFEEQDRK